MILFHDSINNGFNLGLIDIIYLISILCGVCTIVYKNPIVSVLFLIGLFASVASILILVGFNFIGLSYILVYVGAVSILFLFILMLINIRISELLNETNNDLPLAVLTVLLFYYIVVQVLPSNLTDNTIISKISNLLSNAKDTQIDKVYNSIPSDSILNKLSVSNDIISDKSEDIILDKSNAFSLDSELVNIADLKEEISYASGKSWDSSLLDITNISSIGNVMYTSYSIWLIIVSIVLLLAMVGAIVITISQKNKKYV
ncbi:NADH dehydrogenase subunit 6 (mitochondrion) [Monascus purpureus]|uniref:NADH-ubiquinone oxidoreductase chain 6 n=1 Tax=Monascus purpureus TaxID=5098 RepID=A0A4P2VP35_MONPU|nr:NADH dehydrogenase subunit 6 [Monascus purpureus]